ncbi:MAG: hypothetical protein GZ088_13255 [Acidipila sp.]|nr:hypothetical protein [Acidipila sp.]
MPVTQTGRYSMNPAYAETLDAAAHAAGQTDNAKHDESPNPNNADHAGQEKAAVNRIEIEPTEEGGFVSRTHREQSEDSQNHDNQHDGWAMPYEEPELRAHPDSAHLLKFLAQELGE